jgi:hypothetical protein
MFPEALACCGTQHLGIVTVKTQSPWCASHTCVACVNQISTSPSSEHQDCIWGTYSTRTSSCHPIHAILSGAAELILSKPSTWIPSLPTCITTGCTRLRCLCQNVM